MSQRCYILKAILNEKVLRLNFNVARVPETGLNSKKKSPQHLNLDLDPFISITAYPALSLSQLS